MSFLILIVLHIITMIAGYATFGDVCQGNILLNYHDQDVLAILGRLATGFSILFGFPLVATGARQAIQGIMAADSLGFLSPPVLKKKHHSDNATCATHVPLVICILLFCTIISCTVQDVSVVVSLTGAVIWDRLLYTLVRL